jgi:hypothetical protein
VSSLPLTVPTYSACVARSASSACLPPCSRRPRLHTVPTYNALREVLASAPLPPCSFQTPPTYSACPQCIAGSASNASLPTCSCRHRLLTVPTCSACEKDQQWSCATYSACEKSRQWSKAPSSWSRDPTFNYSADLPCMREGPAVENTLSPTVPTCSACEKSQQWRAHLYLQRILEVHARRASSGDHTFTYSAYLPCMREGPAVENTLSPTVPTSSACEKGQQWRAHLYLQRILEVHARRASSGDHTFTYSAYLPCMREGPAVENTLSPTVPTSSACEKGFWTTTTNLLRERCLQARRGA